MRFQPLTALTFLTLTLFTTPTTAANVAQPTTFNAIERIANAYHAAPTGFSSAYASFASNWYATETFAAATSLLDPTNTGAFKGPAQSDLNERELAFISTQTYIVDDARETLMADMKVVAGYKTLPRETDGARPGREGVNSSAGSTAAGVVGAVVAAFVAGVMAL